MMEEKFDQNTLQHLDAYVYMLFDPRDEKPFYVGKGRANRVFQHMQCALKDIDVSIAKYEIIRAINNSPFASPKHIIVRHGLTDKEAFQIESSLIDSLKLLGLELSNLVSGHNAADKGIMTAEQIMGLYNAEDLTELPGDCIIININKKYPKARLAGPNAIYNATRGVWAISKSVLLTKNDEIIRKYVLSEYRGLIVEVFEVLSWFQENRGYNSKANKPAGAIRKGWSFIGQVADPLVRNKFINKSIAHTKKKGAASAHRINI
jgi:hypothetical protein